MLILCKRSVEFCLNIFFQRIQHLFIDFQRNQHKPYIISAHSADFLQKYPLTAADPRPRERFRLINNKLELCIYSTLSLILWIFLVIQLIEKIKT